MLKESDYYAVTDRKIEIKYVCGDGWWARWEDEPESAEHLCVLNRTNQALYAPAFYWVGWKSHLYDTPYDWMLIPPPDVI